MKFRTIFILFNAVIVASFLFVFLLPLFLLGGSYSVEFWKGNWYLALFFLVLLAVLDGFFFSNWKVFAYVENKDWAGLTEHLRAKILAQGRRRPRDIGLFIDACLLRSDLASIESLEQELAAKEPSQLERNALRFGLTRLLRNKPGEAEAFFHAYLDSKKADSVEWLRFNYAFAAVLQKKIDAALPYLKTGADSRDAVLSLLSAYLISSLGVHAASSPEEALELGRKAEDVRSSLAKRFPEKRWQREVERAKAEFHVVVLSKLIDDAGAWLSSAQQSKPGESEKEIGHA